MTGISDVLPIIMLILYSYSWLLFIFEKLMNILFYSILWEISDTSALINGVPVRFSKSSIYLSDTLLINVICISGICSPPCLSPENHSQSATALQTPWIIAFVAHLCFEVRYIPQHRNKWNICCCDYIVYVTVVFVWFHKIVLLPFANHTYH